MKLPEIATVAEKVALTAPIQFDWTTLISSALVAAVISALVSIFGQLVTRQNAKLAAQIAQENARLSAKLEVETTLSRSRQEWINALREDMAQLVGLSAKRVTCLSEDKQYSDEEFERMMALSARIRMRLNPNNEFFDELWALMSAISVEKDVTKAAAANREFVALCQKILKQEWDVLKADLRAIGINVTANE